MRISDWSSDVCSSDLLREHVSCQPADYGSVFDRGQGDELIAVQQLAEIRRGGLRGGVSIQIFEGLSEHRKQCAERLDVASGQSANREGCPLRHGAYSRSEEHTSELQSLMRTSYAVFCLNRKQT